MQPTTEEELTAEVVARIDATGDPRLREIVQALVHHLHAFAAEVRLTEAEWMGAIRFLTDTGQITDEKRQEFILLSDTLGLSMLVDMITHGASEEVTESTVLGPFYVAGAPFRENGASIVLGGRPGEPLLVSGTVRDPDGAPVPGAVVDVWQTAPNGLYDIQDPGQPENNLRGRFRANADGQYSFVALRPVDYPVPDDGPVGRMLRATGRHPWRAAHIHAIVSATGYQPVTTHIFDADSEYLGSDTVFAVKPSLVREFVRHEDPRTAAAHGIESPYCAVEQDFVLRRHEL